MILSKLFICGSAALRSFVTKKSLCMNKLHILYQDDGLVAVDKPAGILVHQTRIPESDDQVVMKILRDQLGQKIYTIHRLDRPTSDGAEEFRPLISQTCPPSCLAEALA